jgi:hypothetical protein
MAISIRHATTPYLTYRKYYTQTLSSSELKDQILLRGGLDQTPERVNREIEKAFS